MKTLPREIISLEKWTGDVEAIVVMEEAWFRIKGIPMKFRSKSTAFYAASLVGKPLALEFFFVSGTLPMSESKLVVRISLWCLIPELGR
jgi:hypothetical protein